MKEAISRAEDSRRVGEPSAVSVSPRPLRVLVAASGTGGHLVPALHIIRGIAQIRPDAVVECIGTGKPLEEKILVANGFKRHLIKAAGVKRRGVLGLLSAAIALPVGVVQCYRLFRAFKPDVVVGVGGYVSVVPVIVARVLGIPTWIHEAELHPGLANKTLGYFADRISISFAETKVKGRAKAVFTGHPVRPELKNVDRSKIVDAPKRLLILGGSQGARGIDQVVPDIAPVLNERGIEVVHQCRPENMEIVVNSYRAAQVNASVVSFVEDMAGAYDWSDVIISRAGASTVAEVASVNRPAIFIPYPFQQGTHQSDNAQSIAALGKALVVEENQPEFSRRLRLALEAVLDPVKYREMKERSCEPRGLEAASVIAREIVSLVQA